MTERIAFRVEEAAESLGCDTETVRRWLAFDVLRRDDHRCRYCGRSAPEVKLHVDHITPVVRGGSNDPDNLITACQDCNLGKGAK